MSTYNLDLYFAANDLKSGQVPGAVAYVRVKTSTSDRTGEETFVSHQCMSPKEFQMEIQRLKKELDEIERRGVRKLRDYEAQVFGEAHK